MATGMEYALALGVDERAAELLSRLEDGHQQKVLQKLEEGIQDGKVRNPSAFVVGACQDVELLGLDDGATVLLKGLPKFQRKMIVDKLKAQGEGVRNPSAWVVKSIQTLAIEQNKGKGGMAMGKGYGKGGAQNVWKGGFQVGGVHQISQALDDSAMGLLQSLPPEKQEEIISKLKNMESVRNPSAWVARAALEAGAPPKQPGMGGMAGSITPVGMQASPMIPAARTSSKWNLMGLDANALAMLEALPEHSQEEIMQKLQEGALTGNIRNPSAWVSKAARAAGSSPSPAALTQGAQTYRAGTSGLDANASALLSSLPSNVQETIMEKLQEIQNRGGIQNPSGWVVKAALNAGAQPQGGKGKGGGKGARMSPY